jgi:hypothetical protein
MITSSSKIKKIIQDSRDLYHTQDLGVLWGIDNKDTLHTTIKRYVDRGILNRIYKGFYSTKPIKEIDPVKLGLSALHRFGYLSTESILVENGIIFQDIKYITFISSVSYKLSIKGYNFLVRKIKDEYLYNELGIISENGIRKASTERAVADMLYLNPNYHFDAYDSINWEKVNKIRKKIYGFSN